MWDLPKPGLEPVFPTLAGGFLTTAPPGKPQTPLLDRGCMWQGSERTYKMDKIVMAIFGECNLPQSISRISYTLHDLICTCR